jgi:hypothetical protein
MLSINVEVDLTGSTLLGEKFVGRRPLAVTGSKKGDRFNIFTNIE